MKTETRKLANTVFCSLILGLTIAFPSTLSADPILNIQPLSLNVQTGDTFEVEVTISEVEDLVGWQFDIGFDPSVLSVNGITEGNFLSGAGPMIFIPGFIDNVGGTLSMSAAALLGPFDGASGSGLLATISFTALADGFSLISISNELLVNSSLDLIAPATLNSATVKVSASNVPEPSTLVLSFSGLAGWLARTYQRKRSN